MGSGMVPFERALVSCYRPSIVTFPLSLRVSEILPRLFSSTPLLPYPTTGLPEISPCFPAWEQVDRLLATKSEGAGLIVRAISFQDFHPMYVITNHQRYRRTDGQTDDMRSQDRAFAFCTRPKVHCAVKITLFRHTSDLFRVSRNFYFF